FNDGTQLWRPGQVGLLVCLADKSTCNVPSPNAAYAANWYSTTVYATVTTLVPPGSNGFFIYNFKVPDNTLPGTTATFNGDVGLIGAGGLLRPQGYFQSNTTPTPTGALTVSPAGAALPVGGQLQFTASSPSTWTVLGGCGAITTTGLFAATATNSLGQPCTVVAASGGRSASVPISVFGGPASLACSADKTNPVADGISTILITATLKDANGNTVSNATSPQVTFSDITPSLATQNPVGPQTPTAGVASTTMTTTAVAGDIQVTAAAPGLIGCNVIVTSVRPGAAVKTTATFLTNPIAADGTSTSVLRVETQDVNGNRASNDNLTQLTATRSSSSSSLCKINSLGSWTTSAVQGRAEFTVQATTTPGQCQVLITTNNTSIPGTSATLTTQLTGVANKLGISGNDSPKVAGNTMTLTVDVQDANGLRITSSSALVTMQFDPTSCTGAPGGSAVAPSGQSVLSSQGRATFTVRSDGSYPACVLTFNSSGVTGTNTTIRFDAGAPNSLSCTFAPTAILADGLAIATATVRVRDAAGNLVTTGGPWSITFTRATGGFTTLLTSNPQLTASGSASFTVRSSTTIGVDSYNASVTPASQPTLPTPTTPQACSISVQSQVP
ncbi:MAG TPA: hypothetical protein VGT60_09305, partial [Candidatus Limnocylindria bacterium]|nr:hypothetical protein [Candidatus Limnocylindria bacterium]